VLQSSSLDATTFVANVWRDSGPWHGLRPYAGVGLGDGTLKLNDRDGNFAFAQLGIGGSGTSPVARHWTSATGINRRHQIQS
jgi:hypothetical protein